MLFFAAFSKPEPHLMCGAGFIHTTNPDADLFQPFLQGFSKVPSARHYCKYTCWLLQAVSSCGWAGHFVNVLWAKCSTDTITFLLMTFLASSVFDPIFERMNDQIFVSFIRTFMVFACFILRIYCVHQ